MHNVPALQIKLLLSHIDAGETAILTVIIDMSFLSGESEGYLYRRAHNANFYSLLLFGG